LILSRLSAPQGAQQSKIAKVRSCVYRGLRQHSKLKRLCHFTRPGGKEFFWGLEKIDKQINLRCRIKKKSQKGKKDLCSQRLILGFVRFRFLIML